MDIGIKLAEIQKALFEIDAAIEDILPAKEVRYLLEQASNHLRALARLLVTKTEKKFIASMKNEVLVLFALTSELENTSGKCPEVAKALREIGIRTSHLIDIFELVK